VTVCANLQYQAAGPPARTWIPGGLDPAYQVSEASNQEGCCPGRDSIPRLRLERPEYSRPFVDRALRLGTLYYRGIASPRRTL